MRKLKRTAIICTCVIGAMIGMSFAAVPLYDLFCRTTGFGGTPQIASQNAQSAIKQSISNRKMTIRFDANVSSQLSWRFKAKNKALSVNMGEPYTAQYHIENLMSTPSKATATYNVVPEQAGQYFIKMQCFCFTEQALGAKQAQDMSVVFYIDPEIEEDPELKNVDTITLSYTFFPIENEAQAGSESSAVSSN